MIPANGALTHCLSPILPKVGLKAALCQFVTLVVTCPKTKPVAVAESSLPKEYSQQNVEEKLCCLWYCSFLVLTTKAWSTSVLSSYCCLHWGGSSLPKPYAIVAFYMGLCSTALWNYGNYGNYGNCGSWVQRFTTAVKLILFETPTPNTSDWSGPISMQAWDKSTLPLYYKHFPYCTIWQAQQKLQSPSPCNHNIQNCIR